MSKSFVFFLLGLLLWPMDGCRSTGDSGKIAEVDGVAITQADLDRSGGKLLSGAREQLYKLERQKLEEYIGATLLTREAEKRNISVSTLLENEVNSKVPQVTEEEIRQFYDSNKSRLPVAFEKVHDQIRDFLRDQKIEKQKREFFAVLRSKADVRTYFKPPPVYRAPVKIKDAPLRGTADSKVTIVKFEDFQCPYCRTVQATFKDLLKKYNGKVRLFHKDLPLDAIHPRARQAAEAARCAGEQGKFWEYHDKLYDHFPKSGVEELKTYAKEIGLNLSSFEQCFTSGKNKSVVQSDVNEAAQLGLTGTPAFFINGREISGAQPLEKFAEIIEEELAQAR